MSVQVTGMVLAGGKSQRMGRNKALLPWRDGETQLTWAVKRLQPICREVLILSSNFSHAVPGHRLVPDAIEARGPLGGIVAGLQASATDWNLVLACDMPFVGEAALRRLIAEAGPDLDAVVYLTHDRLQPLAALYHRRALPAMRAALDADRLRMQDLLRTLNTKIIHPMSEDSTTFSNLNSPADLPAPQVRILLFAGLRERLGFGEREMHFADTSAVRRWLEKESPEVAQIPYLLAVNQEIVRDDIPLKEGDAVAIMPPFAGG